MARGITASRHNKIIKVYGDRTQCRGYLLDCCLMGIATSTVSVDAGSQIREKGSELEAVDSRTCEQINLRFAEASTFASLATGNRPGSLTAELKRLARDVHQEIVSAAPCALDAYRRDCGIFTVLKGDSK